MSSHFEIAKQVFSEEVRALQSTLPQLEPNFDAVVELILNMDGKLAIAGVGKSGVIGQKIASTLSSTGTPTMFINASEALHGDLGILRPKDVVMMISNSGSTVDLVEMLPSLEHFETPIIGIFGNTQTDLAQRCNLVLDASVDKEACPLNLAPMSSTTVALVIGDSIAAALMQARGFKPEDFALRHPGGFLGRRLLLKVRNVMHTEADLAKLNPEADFKEVLMESARPNLGAVCIVEDKKLIGIITDGDIRRFLLKHPSIEGYKAKDCISKNPTVIAPNASVDAALRLMERKKIYNLPVTESCGKLLGILGMHDILSGRKKR